MMMHMQPPEIPVKYIRVALESCLLGDLGPGKARGSSWLQLCLADQAAAETSRCSWARKLDHQINNMSAAVAHAIAPYSGRTQLHCRQTLGP